MMKQLLGLQTKRGLQVSELRKITIILILSNNNKKTINNIIIHKMANENVNEALLRYQANNISRFVVISNNLTNLLTHVNIS